MSPFLSTLASRLTPADSISRRDLARVAPVAACHLAALAVMMWSEAWPVPAVAFLLTWGMLNFFWLALLRRPALSAALSFAMFVILILISRFKFDVLWMTASFVDVMVIDLDTFAFLWMVFPNIRLAAIAVTILAVPLLVLFWRVDPLRLRRRTALAGGVACLAGLTGLSLAYPVHPGEAFGDGNYVSAFARSGVDAVSAYAADGFLESDATVTERLRFGMEESCASAGKRPHIILLHDESSYDIRMVNGIKVPEDYARHFQSFDGKERKFLVEGAGGPSWYTEYNVLSGLSSRSYRHFQFFVTRIAAGRVARGLPNALKRCGYHTFSIYPAYGSFLGARSFYQGTGVETFLDGKDIGGGVFEPDRFYFDIAARMIDRQRDNGPMFLHVYLTANHFPYDYPFRPDLTPDGWRDPGNAVPEVNEYLRRQAMTARDYAAFRARLKRDFPAESFLIVRFGDHQPDFGKLIVDTKIDEKELGRRLMSYDPRYYTTYYAIDAINFRPVNLSSALETLDAPYLPLVVQEAAGLSLDPSFAEQKRILARCNGLFYGCAGGAEARRFNRLLIDAGLIKGL
jgi:phosphoglycerol transferase MdoB-like AlkP superfamily enzyme